MNAPEDLLASALEHHQAGRWREAELLYRQALHADPNHPDALHLLGLLAHQFGQGAMALELISRAVRQRGDIPAYHNNLGEVLRKLGRYGDALAAYQQALRLDPHFAEAHNNLGTIHQDQGWIAGALACYERAIGCRGDYATARYNRARCLLSLGEWQAGFREYEWRWRRSEFQREDIAGPEWDGSPLDGRTLLVRAEQGLGDTLQFARFVKYLAERGERVVFQVQPVLLALLRESGFEGLVGQGEPLPAYDVHCMLLTLPRWLGVTPKNLPCEVPYLAAEARRIERWRERLREIPGFRIGIHWQGYQHSPLEPWRSMKLVNFEPLARCPGARLISLQKGFGSEQIAQVAGRFQALELGGELDPGEDAFVDTAAVMRGLDLVVTSDSAVAHLAGALGVPVWVALPVSADWRWLREREDCPWYPTMRLFRQRELGEWAEVFERIAVALAGLRHEEQPGP